MYVYGSLLTDQIASITQTPHCIIYTFEDRSVTTAADLISTNPGPGGQNRESRALRHLAPSRPSGNDLFGFPG